MDTRTSVSVLVLLAGLSSSAFGNEADAVVKKFFKEIEARKISEATKLFVPDAFAASTNDEIKFFYQDMATRFERCGGIKDVQVLSKPAGDRRHAKYSIVFSGNCEPARGGMTLKKQDSRWLLLPD